jgi:sugar phosphate isomerase/epimerase
MLRLAPCLSTIDLAQDIPILVKNGVKMITINDNDLFLDASDERLLEIRKIFEDAGIEIHSVHAPSSKFLTSSDCVLRAQSVEKFSRLIRQLSVAGVGIMVHHGGEVENDNRRSPAFSMVLESLKSLVKVAEEHRVVLALENDSYQNAFPRGFCSNSQTILELLESIDSPWLKACFDTGHAHIHEGMQETIKDAVRHLGDRIVTIHMQDNDGFGDLHLQPGYGTIDWDEFVRALKDIGYNHPITIESGPWAGGTFRCMLEEVKALLKDSGADIAEELTLRPKADWVKNFQSGRTTHEHSDLILRCQRCGHYIVWTSEGGHCACDR